MPDPKAESTPNTLDSMQNFQNDTVHYVPTFLRFWGFQVDQNESQLPRSLASPMGGIYFMNRVTTGESHRNNYRENFGIKILYVVGITTTDLQYARFLFMNIIRDKNLSTELKTSEDEDEDIGLVVLENIRVRFFIPPKLFNEEKLRKVERKGNEFGRRLFQ
ncbi:hypothetical protein HK098_001848 [Nowakowskiella sp. JEL0407]|nr:hypothetical protein HK098_001848 [Nowakowskiella sp. JEL0407]